MLNEFKIGDLVRCNYNSNNSLYFYGGIVINITNYHYRIYWFKSYINNIQETYTKEYFEKYFRKI